MSILVVSTFWLLKNNTIIDFYMHAWIELMYAKSSRSCPTLCDPMDRSLPGSSVHGILQARILEWVAMPSARGFSWPRDWTCISHVSCTGRQFLTTSTTWEAPPTCMYKFSVLLGGVEFHLEVELLGHIVTISLTFSGTARLFSKDATPFYLPTRSIWESQFSYILANTFFLFPSYCDIIDIQHISLRYYITIWLSQ